MTKLLNKNLLLSAILFVSLAANFTIGGIVLGRGMMSPPPPPHGSFDRHDPIARMEQKLELLPKETQDQTQDILDDYRPQMEDALDAIKAARKASFRYVQSGDYSRAEAEQKFEDLSKSHQQMQSLAQKMLLDMADNLTPEQRKEIFRRDK